MDLDAEEDQLDFPMIYDCAKEGWCTDNPNEVGKDLKPLFQTIIDFFPEPGGDPTATLQFLVTQLDYDPYVGRLAIGRIMNGTMACRDELLLCAEDVDRKVKINKLYTWKGLNRIEIQSAEAGEIVAIAGIADLNIGDTLTAMDDPRPLPRTMVDEPTIGITIMANTGPFSGREGKYVTAGNASQLSDGAAAVVVMEAAEAKKRGIEPLGRFVGFNVAGCDPDEMGIGPVFAVPRLLERHGLKVDDIDLWELNEAFASQCLYSRDRLGIDPEKYNVNGGSISIGHPFGMTGARCTGSMLLEGSRRGAKWGVVTMGGGGGRGVAGRLVM